MATDTKNIIVKCSYCGQEIPGRVTFRERARCYSCKVQIIKDRNKRDLDKKKQLKEQNQNAAV